MIIIISRGWVKLNARYTAMCTIFGM